MNIKNINIVIVVFVAVLALWGMISPASAFAQNNKFGIHVTVPTDTDLDRAAALVNGDSGAYGYVKLVIQQGERDAGQWQSIFDKLRERRLIPVIRIATEPEGENWQIPRVSEATSWAQFLNSLNWVTEKRYVILFNEPNHANEWGGAVDPTGYGRVAAVYAEALKNASADFSIMLAGLDLTAPEARPMYADAQKFLQTSIPEFCAYFTARNLICNDYIDAISSHSYPNPGFSGTPFDTGRSSIRGYQYELGWYRGLLGKELPVYITETGWDTSKVGHETAASYFVTAFTSVWLPDERVQAVIPFLLNYQTPPFLQFSFLSQGENPQPYSKYLRIQSLAKVQGAPSIRDTAQVAGDIPARIVEESSYSIPFAVKNTGQAIWDAGVYTLILETTDFEEGVLMAEPISLPKLTPLHETYALAQIRTGYTGEIMQGTVSAVLMRGSDEIARTLPQKVVIEPHPSLSLRLTLFAKGLSTGDDFEVQIFDNDEALVYKKSSVKVTLGRATVEGISNVAPGRKYRVVILKPYYLPRQAISTFADGVTTIEFEELLPLDFNQDGKLSLADIPGLFTQKDSSDMGFFEKVRLLLP